MCRIFTHLYIFVVTDPAAATVDQTNKEEVDARSVFVGNVRFLLLFLLAFLEFPLSIKYLVAGIT